MISHNNDNEIYHLPRLKKPKGFHHWQLTILVGNMYDSIINSFVIIILCATTISNTKAQFDSDFEVKPETFYVNEHHCLGEWKYPLNCTTFNCDYKATWEYRDDNDEIIFTISTRNRNKWTGIGFSDNPYMPDTDAVLGLVEESGRFFLMDSYLKAYEAPPLDYQQNLYNMSAWRENGLTTLRFSRPRQTGDSKDYQFSDTDCPYFMFPVMGGVFNAVNKRIRKHENTPVISDRRICVRSCRAPSTTTTTTTMTTSTSLAPTMSKNNVDLTNSVDRNHPINSHGDSQNEKTKVYQAELKFLNLMTPGNNKSPSNEMLKIVESNLYRELKPHFDQIQKIEINELKNDPSNNVVMIDLTITHGDRDEKEDIRALTTALNSVIKDSQIGKWNVDSNHLVVTQKESKSNGWMNIILDSFNRFNEEEQKWIIIGAGLSALVLLALIQLLCMFCSCSCSSKKLDQEDYVNEKDDKQWSNEHYPTPIYNGYAVDDPYGYHQGKSNSLHKNYHRGEHGDPRSIHYANGHHGHQSLERRHYHDQHGGNRRQVTGGYEMNERQHQHHHHHHHPSLHARSGGPPHLHHLQPDFYFMPHQRKYSSDVVRVYVDYDGN